MLNREVQLYVPRKYSYPIPLSNIDCHQRNLCRSGNCTKKRIYDYWDLDMNRNLSYSWTGFTRFTLLSEIPQKGYNQSERRLTKIQTTSRPDYVWPDGRTRNGKVIGKLLFHAKRPYSRTCIRGNRCSKNDKSQSVWSKEKFSCIDIAGTWRNSVLYYNFGTRIRSDEKMKAIHLIFFLLMVKESKRMLSCFETRRVCGTTFFEQLLKPGEYEILSSVDRGRKKYKLRILFCSANLGCTHKQTECHEWFRQFWRSVSQRRLPRETESTCKRSFTPSNVDSKCWGSSGQGMKGRCKEAHKTTRKVHFVALMDNRLVKSTCTFPGMFERAISSEELILCLMNLYVWKDFFYRWEVSHGRTIGNRVHVRVFWEMGRVVEKRLALAKGWNTWWINSLHISFFWRILVSVLVQSLT